MSTMPSSGTSIKVSMVSILLLMSLLFYMLLWFAALRRTPVKAILGGSLSISCIHLGLSDCFEAFEFLSDCSILASNDDMWSNFFSGWNAGSYYKITPMQ